MQPDSTQWTVIRRAARGVPEDQSEFVRRYGPIIRSYLGARWRRTPLFAEVDDAAQQVFLDCFKLGGALERADEDSPGGFRAFLFGIVRNVARTTERKRARTREQQPTSDLDLEAIASNEDSYAAVFDRAWASSLLRAAAELQLARAKKKGDAAIRRHRLLQVRYSENLPIRRIAERWSVDPAVLHREYPKAKEEFKRALFEVVREQQGGGALAVERECSRLLSFFS